MSRDSCSTRSRKGVGDPAQGQQRRPVRRYVVVFGDRTRRARARTHVRIRKVETEFALARRDPRSISFRRKADQSRLPRAGEQQRWRRKRKSRTAERTGVESDFQERIRRRAATHAGIRAETATAHTTRIAHAAEIEIRSANRTRSAGTTTAAAADRARRAGKETGNGETRGGDSAGIAGVREASEEKIHLRQYEGIP